MTLLPAPARVGALSDGYATDRHLSQPLAATCLAAESVHQDHEVRGLHP